MQGGMRLPYYSQREPVRQPRALTHEAFLGTYITLGFLSQLLGGGGGGGGTDIERKHLSSVFLLFALSALSTFGLLSPDTFTV